MDGPSADIDPAAYFGFTDLNGFKDYVISVSIEAPDGFMEMDWLKPSEQMNVERAFVGLRYGLKLVAEQMGELPVFARCRVLVEEAYTLFGERDDLSGQRKLEEVERLLRPIPTP